MANFETAPEEVLLPSSIPLLLSFFTILNWGIKLGSHIWFTISPLLHLITFLDMVSLFHTVRFVESLWKE